MSLTMKGSVVLASAWGAAALGTSSSRGFLGSSGGMRPDVVAATLVKVEDEWTAQAAAFVECSASSEAGLNCAIPGKAFAKSCNRIVSAVVQASSGDRDQVSEYMADVCKEPSLVNERRARCQGLAALITQQMSADSYANRETFDAQPLCAHLFESVSAEEKVAIDKRMAEEAKEAKAEVERKKAEEEVAKKRQAEEDAAVAAAAKKAEEAAKAEQEAEAVAKAAEESAKKQVHEAAVASIATGNKTHAVAQAVKNQTKPVSQVSAAAPAAKKAPPAAAKVQKKSVAAKVEKSIAKDQKAGDAPAHKK